MLGSCTNFAWYADYLTLETTIWEAYEPGYVVEYTITQNLHHSAWLLVGRTGECSFQCPKNWVMG